MSNYNQLVKRLDALGGASPTFRDYTIHLLNKEENLPPGRRFFKTPDEALEDIYEDGRKHGAKKIYVVLFFFFEGNLDDYEGYYWIPEISFLHPDGFETEEESLLRVFGDAWLNRSDPIAYPNPKPELELFEDVMTRELEWCIEWGYPSIEDWDKHEVEDLNKNDPGRFSVETISRSSQLIQQYRRAGYDVDYLHEPKNHVEVLKSVLDRRKKEQENS